MVTFLFWNLNKKPLMESVARLVRKHHVDVLMLAECVIESKEIVAKLNGGGGPTYSLPASSSAKVKIFTRFPTSCIIEELEDPIRGLTIRELRIGSPPSIILAAVHLPSRRNWNRDDQTLGSTTVAQSISKTESMLGHSRTILVGDLNMNPFDPGVVGAQALNAVMTRHLARRGMRSVRGNSYKIFYNPMWAFFGDRTEGPPGSLYYNAATPSNHFWNIDDQVLLRPELMDDLVEVRILDSDGEHGLLTKNGLPKKSTGSDHLPLLFRMNL